MCVISFPTSRGCFPLLGLYLKIQASAEPRASSDFTGSDRIKMELKRNRQLKKPLFSANKGNSNKHMHPCEYIPTKEILAFSSPICSLVVRAAYPCGKKTLWRY